MASQYELHLDVPFVELDELGYSRSRLMRDAAPAFNNSSMLGTFIEPITGTLMIKPHPYADAVQFPELFDRAKMEVSKIDYQEDYWKEITNGTFVENRKLTLLSSTVKKDDVTVSDMRITGFDDINMTVVGGIPGGSPLPVPVTMLPIMATKYNLDVNRGVAVYIMTHGWGSVELNNFLGIRMGGFYLQFHREKGAELYWNKSVDPSKEEWQWCKSFSSFEPMSTSRVLPSGEGYGKKMSVVMLPFGCGNLMVDMKAAGSRYSNVYHNPKAYVEQGYPHVYITTKQEPVVIYTEENGDPKNIAIAIEPLVFFSKAHFNDVPFKIPYAPRQPFGSRFNWTASSRTAKISGQVNSTTTHALFHPDGEDNEYYASFELTGNGLDTPFLHSYQVSFPETTRYVERETIQVKGLLGNIRIGEGELWQDSHFEVTIVDKERLPMLDGLFKRSIIRGAFVYNNQVHSLIEFSSPSVQRIGSCRYIRLKGKNAGVAAITRKRFTNPDTFDGMTVTESVSSMLRMAGFPSTALDLGETGVRLSSTQMLGEGVEFTESDFLFQPAMNQRISDFLDYIIRSYTHWQLRYDNYGVWRFKSPSEYRVNKGVVFYCKTPPRGSGLPWYAPEWEIWTEPPEANVLYMIGRTEEGSFIGRPIVDLSSIYGHADGTKPTNYIGFPQPLVFVDITLTNRQALKAASDVVADAAFKAPQMIRWKAPFVPHVKVGNIVTLEKIGTVEVKRYMSDFVSPKEMEHSVCTNYEGEIVELDEELVL